MIFLRMEYGFHHRLDLTGNRIYVLCFLSYKMSIMLMNLFNPSIRKWMMKVHHPFNINFL